MTKNTKKTANYLQFLQIREISEDIRREFRDVVHADVPIEDKRNRGTLILFSQTNIKPSPAGTEVRFANSKGNQRYNP